MTMWNETEPEEETFECDVQTSELLELIQTQYACKGKSHEWRPAVARLYSAAIVPLPSSIAKEIVIRVILSSPFLPTASDIWQRALDIASPTLPDFEAWALTEKYMGRKWPPGVPTLVRRAAEDMSGLHAIWHRYHWMRESIGRLRQEYIDSYNSRVESHREAVTQELLKPAWKRNPELFPPGSPFISSQLSITS